jgi:holo-[acyl-carrier protein] synthase
MNLKIGTDIVVIDRIRKSADRFGETFYKRFLTESERARIRRIETAAGIWAAKEAAAKALGCGIGKALNFHDMEVCYDHNGAPFLVFDETVKKRHGIGSHSLSITHDGGFALAVVALYQVQPKE